ncbi:hypothetical protein RB213_000990 [Colletotrichum asianum]
MARLLIAGLLMARLQMTSLLPVVFTVSVRQSYVLMEKEWQERCGEWKLGDGLPSTSVTVRRERFITSATLPGKELSDCSGDWMDNRPRDS